MSEFQYFSFMTSPVFSLWEKGALWAVLGVALVGLLYAGFLAVVTSGHQTQGRFWQNRLLMVVLLAGAAKLRFRGGRVISMKPGSSVWIRAGRAHRVEWTEPGVKTVWFAIHTAC